MTDRRTLVLRLAGPLQSWGSSSQFNVRDTDDRPTKSGVIGLLAAAQGRRRGDEIADLLELSFAVRVDQPGSRLRDYHTVRTLDGGLLPSAKVNAKGVQVAASGKPSHVTQRFYLQDAVFVAFVEGPAELMSTLAWAVTHPVFPLALGRRSCVPSRPLLVSDGDSALWSLPLDEAVRTVPWQAGIMVREHPDVGDTVSLAMTIDDPAGLTSVADVPTTFDHRKRNFENRQVCHGWVRIDTGLPANDRARQHDPFALLGW